MAIPAINPVVDSLLRFRTDPWEFASKCVRTLDQADRWNPIKPYPVHLDYLKYVVGRIVSDRLLALVKHRRMIITWTACMVALWDAMFHEGRFNALMSKKEEDSDELVLRCKFIYDNIPSNALVVKPRLEYKYTEICFPEIDSYIKGFPQGSDQLRQRTCSRIFADEIAFWPQARSSFVAMKPTIEGGGQICLVSTRFPGFFKELVEDALDY
jgi:hypothetical protein